MDSNEQSRSEGTAEDHFQDTIEALRSIPEAVFVEDGRSEGVDGVSVKFEDGVSDYDAAVNLIEQHINTSPVRQYSNMTGVDDEQVIILVELERHMED